MAMCFASESVILFFCSSLLSQLNGFISEDRFSSTTNFCKFDASAAQVFNLTANDLFDRDDLLQGTPEPGGCLSRGSLDYRAIHARGRRSFGRRARGRQGSP